MASVVKPPKGGTIFYNQAASFLAQNFRKDLGNVDSRRRGADVGRDLQPHTSGRVPSEFENQLINKANGHRHGLAGQAREFQLEAHQKAGRRPRELNTAAIREDFTNEIADLEKASKERLKDTVKKLNDARGELNRFCAIHGCGPLAEDAYEIDGTATKPIIFSAAVTAVDSVINAVQFIAVMPGGLTQALAISGGMSASMALLGATVGTSSRFWCYGEPGPRRTWRTVGTLAAVLAAGIAGFFAQYRALLEQAARTGVEPDLGKLLSTAPTPASIMVFVCASLVAIFAAVKFRGGPGTPWARFGDQALKDRPVRRLEQRLYAGMARFFEAVKGIRSDVVQEFTEHDAEDRKALDEAFRARDAAKLHIDDLEGSDRSYFNLILTEIKQYRAGILAVRPELRASQFDELPVFEAQEFPDTDKLDRAVTAMEDVFRSRTEQLAELHAQLGQLERQACASFEDYLSRVANIAEADRHRDSGITRTSFSSSSREG